jgi:hypothetical protein
LQLIGRNTNDALMNMSRVLLVVALLAIWGVGCGSNSSAGGSSGATCEAVTACGGDLTGDWKVIAVCVDQTSLDAQAKQICDSASVALVSPKVTGSIAYKADKTFTQTASTADATAEFTLAASCLKQGSATFTCDEVQAELNPDAAAPATTCVAASGGGCKCSAKVHESSMSSGTYALSGTSVTLTAGTDIEKQDYCVKGDKLYLLPTADSALPGQLEFQKQ